MAGGNSKPAAVAMVENPFRYVMPLEHMSKVKIIETLWRSCQDLRYSLKDSVEYYFHLPKLLSYMRVYIDFLPLPQIMKTELITYAVEMLQTVLDWLYRTDLVLNWLWPPFHKCPKLYEYFIDNFTWDNVGYPNGRQMLRSYVRNQEKIDFRMWVLLCEYCIEEDIIRFSRTIDWTSPDIAFDKSLLAVYWYWRINGQFPPEAMYNNQFGEYSHVMAECRPGGLYDESNMVLGILSNIHNFGWAHILTMPAIRYLRQELKDEKKFQEVYLNTVQLQYWTSAAYFNLVGEIADETWINSQHATSYMCTFATCWPSVILAHDWISMLEEREVLLSHFFHLFWLINGRMAVLRELEAEGMRHEELIDRTVFKPCKQFLRLFKRKCRANGGLINHIAFMFFRQQNITLCRLIFEEMGNELGRKDFLDTLQEQHAGVVAIDLQRNTPFFCQFSEQVLVSDEERSLFWRILGQAAQYENLY